MATHLATSDPGFETAFSALLAAKRETDADVDDAVAAIIADVAARGDAALVDYTARFDRVVLRPAQLRLSADEIAASAAQASAETVAALRLAAGRIESFHRKQLPQSLDYTDADGVRLGMLPAHERFQVVLGDGRHCPSKRRAIPATGIGNQSGRLSSSYWSS